MKVTTLNTLEKTKVAMDGAEKVWRQVPISKADGTPTFSFRVFTVEPKGHTPFHSHPFEHCNYIIEGRGLLVREDGRGIEVKKGDFALVLPNEKHQYKNASDMEPFVMICAVPKEYE